MSSTQIEALRAALVLARDWMDEDAPEDVVAALRNPWLEIGDQSDSSIGALAAMALIASETR